MQMPKFTQLSNFTKSQILAMAEGGFFGKGNAQLPSDAMLMIDEISHISNSGGLFEKGQLDANLQIKPDHWFLAAILRGTL